MFKRNVKSIGDVINHLLRDQGLETPLLQRRLIDAWETVTGTTVGRYTGEKFIKNQTLFVKITNPALRQDLSMMRSKLVQRLNAEAELIDSEAKKLIEQAHKMAHEILEQNKSGFTELAELPFLWNEMET